MTDEELRKQAEAFSATVSRLAEVAHRLPEWKRGPVGAGLYPQEYPEAMRRFREREEARKKAEGTAK